MHVYQPTITSSRSWPQIVLRWMPTFLGFPIGGFVAEIVGPIDAVAPAVVGGAITGADPRLRTMARHAPHRSTAAPVDRRHSDRTRGRPRSRRQRGGLRHQHRCSRSPGRDLWCRPRRRASSRSAPVARTDRVGVASRRRRVVGTRLDRQRVHRRRRGIAVHRLRRRAGHSLSPLAHRCWRSRSPAERNVASTTDDRDEGGREGLSRRGSCRPCGRCAHVPSS